MTSGAANSSVKSSQDFTEPSLSVVLPVYNGARYLADAIHSVMAQLQLPARWELIVVDDGSTDNSVSVCQQIMASNPAIRLLQLECNRGVAVARNEGVGLARYTYLSFIDQDDCWTTDKWWLQYQALCQSHTTEQLPLDYVLAMQSFFLEDPDHVPRWFNREWSKVPQKGHVFGCLLIRRELFLQVGLLDESLRFGVDDVDWFVRARQAGLQCDILPDVLLRRRVHDDNASAQTAASNTELLKLIRTKLGA